MSDDLKKDINEICDEIASGDADQIRQKTKEVCIKVVEDTEFSDTRVPTASGLEAFQVTGGKFKEVVIEEGEMFLLPGTHGPAPAVEYELMPIHSQHATQPMSLRGYCGDRDRASEAISRSR